MIGHSDSRAGGNVCASRGIGGNASSLRVPPRMPKLQSNWKMEISSIHNVIH